WILDKAADGRQVHYADVLEGYFGWKARSMERQEVDDANGLKGGELYSPTFWHFSCRRIGERAYRQVMATLCRSCASLRARGLVARGWSHRPFLVITEQGKEWLSINSDYQLCTASTDRTKEAAP